jgi:phytoene synthase
MMSDDLDDLIRRVDPDRWLSSRFIGDAGKRADVIALYAYDHELARAPKVASNPLLGEIRLTWWREMLDEAYEGRPVRRHPTAQALADVIKRRELPRDWFELMIDGRYEELDGAPMSPGQTLSWAIDTAGQAAKLAALILDPDCNTEPAQYPGVVWALSRRGEKVHAEQAESARDDARLLSAAAFPAIAHATLALRPARSEFAKRLRLTWAVARGRI